MPLDLAKQLIAKASITPDDAGCQTFIANYLANLGFEITALPYGDVSNLWATYGNSDPLFVFAGHTDVVPPGPLDKWTSDPFTPAIRSDYLFGRGAADMKSSIAAMMAACRDFLAKKPKFDGRIGLLITSDEEGIAENGTKKVVAFLKQQQIIIDYCLVGEASSETKFGDTLKIGRRGSLSGKLIIHGKQGHIAYPQLADNPIHRCPALLQELVNYRWDEGNEYFQPTQFQISNIHAGSGANNVIPHEVIIDFNFRYAPVQTTAALQAIVENLLEKNQLKFTLTWHHSGKPFFSKPDKLANSLAQVIKNVADITPKFSTSGGTSDGRFLIDICKELIEFGPINESIHKIDENISVTDLVRLKLVYQQLLEKLFLRSAKN